MREYFIVLNMNGECWVPSRKLFRHTNYPIKYNTKQEAFTEAEKIPKGVLYKIGTIYVNDL